MKLYKYQETVLPRRVALIDNEKGDGLPSTKGQWTKIGETDVIAGQKGRIGMSDDEILETIERDGVVVL